MKRDPKLYPLSWDHHHGLAFARWLKNALAEVEPTSAAIERLIAELEDFWRKELGPHFEAEETALFPAVRGRGPQPELETALAEHGQMRELLRAITGRGDNTETYHHLRQFAAALTQHIRFEENILFPKIEAALTQTELDEVGRALAACADARGEA